MRGCEFKLIYIVAKKLGIKRCKDWHVFCECAGVENKQDVLDVLYSLDLFDVNCKR